MEEYLENKLGLQIWTDSGWSDFSGLMRKGTAPVVKIATEEGQELTCTKDHNVFTGCLYPQKAQNLTTEDKLIVPGGLTTVARVDVLTDPATVYDIVGVEKNNRFYANDILISNCRFIIFEETLINPLFLSTMAGIDPIFKMGQVRWYKRPSAELMYVLSLDPAVGTGGDNAAIQVIELPTMIQVAEWCHNKTPIEGQLKVLQDIMKFMSTEYGVVQIYWSVENNSVGEAALTVIRETGEEHFRGEFLTEPKGTRKTGSKSKGFHTGAKTKIEACALLKRQIEQNKISVRSKQLVRELKTFVARGHSYSAKPGETDDCVMSLVLNLRLIKFISTFESDVYEAVNSSLTSDDLSDEQYQPMPMAIL